MGLLSLAAAGTVVATVIRLVLLPTDGLRGDIDQFVGWVNGIATNGLGRAFDQELTFGPVIAYVWGLLGAVEPAFQTATDASDPWIRSLMKLPASLADFGLAAGVLYGLRARPALAVIGALAILFQPATWYVSAWWGQWESMYTLLALIAALFAIGGRDGFAAAFVAAAVLTKPQALPLLLPFAAWFLARGGLAGFLRVAAIGLATAAVIWLPFLAAGGPLQYLRGIGELQDETFSILSLRAWNVWWLVQEAAAGGSFASDRTAILGPITFRHIGYGLTGLLSLFVAFQVWRHPHPRTLVLGLAAATLIAFTFLTTMHERYAYAAIVFLLLLIDDRLIRVLAIAFGVVFTLNLLAAVPATVAISQLLPVSGLAGIVGSGLLVSLTVLVVLLTAGSKPGSLPLEKVGLGEPAR